MQDKEQRIKEIQQNPVKELYTDGSCLELYYGGFSVIDNHVPVVKGFEENTTNNRMELKAVIRAIAYADKENANATIYTDSQYVVDGINQWCKKWVKNGWRTSNNKPVKNQDLWIVLLNVLKNSLINVEIKWVKGHEDNPQNIQADNVAVNAAKQCKMIKSQNTFKIEDSIRSAVAIYCDDHANVTHLEGEKYSLEIPLIEYGNSKEFPLYKVLDNLQKIGVTGFLIIKFDKVYNGNYGFYNESLFIKLTFEKID